MLHGSSRPGVAGSELHRLLARLAPARGPSDRAAPAEARPAVVERLGQWLGWTGAIALSEALAAAPAGPRGRAQRDAYAAAEADVRRVQAAQQAANARGPAEPASSPTDFAPYRRHFAERQQAMGEAVAALRQRLRERLSQHSAAGARLAAIDAVMERSLAPHERSLLVLGSLRLQSHFEALAVTAEAALPAFHHDLTTWLQAELAHRLLPAQGLLDALREPR